MDRMSQPEGLAFHEIPDWCVENNRKFSYQASRVDRGIQDAAAGLSDKYEQSGIDADVYSAEADRTRQVLDEFAVSSVHDLPAYAAMDKEPDEYQAMADEANEYLSSGYAADVKALYADVYKVSQVRSPAELCERDVRDNSVKQPFPVSDTARRMLDGLAAGVKDPDIGKPMENYSKFEQNKFDEALDAIARRHTGKSVQEIRSGFDASRAAAKPADEPVKAVQEPARRRTELANMPVTGNRGPSDDYGYDEN